MQILVLSRKCCSREYLRGKYHCTIDLLLDWFGISCVTTDNFCFYLQNRRIQTSQTGGQWYSDTSPFSIPWLLTSKDKWHWNEPVNNTWFNKSLLFVRTFLLQMLLPRTLTLKGLLNSSIVGGKSLYHIYTNTHTYMFELDSFYLVR